MFIPDLHIQNKKTQYKFNLYADLFEDTILFENKTEYEKDRERKKKYSFEIDDKDFKTKIKNNEDINVDILKFFDEVNNMYIEYNNKNVAKFYTDDKKAICRISDKNMNWYLIRMDRDDENGKIICITEKIQDQNEVEQIDKKEENIKYNVEDNEIIQYDLNYDIESIE
jgi:hypothetical protein